MNRDALETARRRYREAYRAYRVRVRRITQKLENGVIPSAEEIAAEAEATHRLTLARRDLLNEMASRWPRA